MAVRGEGMVADEGNEDNAEPSTDAKIVYVLHPNCAVEEY